jgi:hypothetical protein
MRRLAPRGAPSLRGGLCAMPLGSWSSTGSRILYSQCRRCGEVQNAREIVSIRHPPRAVGARPQGHGGGTRAMHPGRARHCGPATRHPASARGPRRSAPHPRWCGGGAERAGRDPRRPVPGKASDAMDAGGVEGFGEGHGWQNGGEPPGQHGRARPGRANEEDVQVRTPASRSASPKLLALPSANTVDLLWRWGPR